LKLIRSIEQLECESLKEWNPPQQVIDRRLPLLERITIALATTPYGIFELTSDEWKRIHKYAQVPAVGRKIEAKLIGILGSGRNKSYEVAVTKFDFGLYKEAKDLRMDSETYEEFSKYPMSFISGTASDRESAIVNGPEGLISVFERFGPGEDEGSETHPPVAKRITRLEEMFPKNQGSAIPNYFE